MRFVLALVAVYSLGAGTLPADPRTVGFRRVEVPGADGAVLQGALWYPSDAAAAPMDVGNTQQTVARDAPLAGDHLPLIVLSHGVFGTWADHADLAVALAKAGFVVVAVSYHQFSPKRVLQVGAWVSGLHHAIDYALRRWPEHARIDPRRIGAFGFSIGGTATLIAAGGLPDPGLARPHCKVALQDWSCTHATNIDLMLSPPPPAATWATDDRLKAVVLAVPAMGFIFGRSGLSGVHVPVQLWEAGKDRVLDPRWNARPIVADLPQAPAVRIAAMADHADFVAPCSARMMARWSVLCRDAWRFDRAKFHTYLDDTIVAFFSHALEVR